MLSIRDGCLRRRLDMAEFRLRQNDPSPPIEFSEIEIPNDTDFGTGSLCLKLRKDSVSPTEIVVFHTGKQPEFQISLTISYQKDELLALLGRADGSLPLSAREFSLASLNWRATRDPITVLFAGWMLTSVTCGTTTISDSREWSNPTDARVVPNWKEVPHEGTPYRYELESTGVTDARDFTGDELDTVSTFLEFELPFSLPYLDGELPRTIPFQSGREGQVLLATRQTHFSDIEAALGLPTKAPPPGSVIVCVEDRHGRVNVSKLQFQFKGYIELILRQSLFDECLLLFNKFLEHYRKSTRRFEFRKLSHRDIVSFTFAHILSEGVWNRVIEPASRIVLEAHPGFANNTLLWFAINSSGELQLELWERLILESRHYLGVGDNRIAVVNAVTALESLLKVNHGRLFKFFFTQRGVRLDEWKNGEKLESVTICLNLLHVMRSQLGLVDKLAERLIEHYNRRNNIVHNGTLKVASADARCAVEDIYFLGRCLLDRFDFTLHCIFRPNAKVEGVDNIRFVDVIFEDEVGTATVRLIDDELRGEIKTPTANLVRLSAPKSALKWIVGQRNSAAISYSRSARRARLLFNDVVLSQADVELDPNFDVAAVRGSEFDENLFRLSAEDPALISINQREIPPEEFVDLDDV